MPAENITTNLPLCPSSQCLPLLLALACSGLLFGAATHGASSDGGAGRGEAVLGEPIAGKVPIQFSLPQHRSLQSGTFDGLAFGDYLWVFFKYSTSNGSDGSWKHATLAGGGSLRPVADRLGVFIDAATVGGAGKTFTVHWNYERDGVRRIDSRTVVRVFAIEMVKVPQGSFFYNVNGVGRDHYNNFGGGAETLVKSVADIPRGARAGWPNGYNAFYVGKYEVSQQQYCDFLNTLPSAVAAKLYSPSGYNFRGYRIKFDGDAPYGKRFTTDAPERACNLISWDDAKAYLSWCGLRPMTEMEFEKAARGTDAGGTNKRAYPWGDAKPTEDVGLIDGGTHTIYYCNWGIAEGGGKPVTVGWYLANYDDERSGASPYGIADLAGNLWEQVIICTWPRAVTNGNGTIQPPDSWPPPDFGKGWRGGGWGYVASDQRISARGDIGWARPRWPEKTRRVNVGIRPARSE